MAYNKSGYFQRAEVIKKITAIHYGPYHDQCLKMVWKKHICKQYGIGYRTYLRYLKASPDNKDKSGYQYRLQFDE